MNLNCRFYIMSLTELEWKNIAKPNKMSYFLLGAPKYNV